MKKLYAELHPQIRAIDRNTHTIELVASDETLDCYREIVRASGWRFTHFAKNPVLVDSHDYSTIERQLGRVTKFAVEAGTGGAPSRLVEHAQLAADVQENRLARLAWQMAEAGYLRACSVGFFPTRSVSKWTNDQKDFLSAIGELKLTPEQAALVQTIFLEQEQLELSLCVIGANPNALARAHADGAVSDADLCGLGFDDEDLSFLHDAAKAYESASPLTKRLIDRELRSIPFRKNPKPQPAPVADGLDAAAEAQHRDEESAFLRKFQNITQST